MNLKSGKTDEFTVVLRAKKKESTFRLRDKLGTTYCEIAKCLQDIECSQSITEKHHAALEKRFNEHIELLEELHEKFINVEFRKVKIRKKKKLKQPTKTLNFKGKTIEI